MDKIPRVFLRKYINQLSNKTFCFLLKLYCSETLDYSNIKGSIFSSSDELEDACSELIANEIVTYKKILNKKKNHVKYILEYIEERKTFYVLYKIKQRNIDNILSKFSERVRLPLKKLISGVMVSYKNLKADQTYKLLLPFFDVSDACILRVCEIYNIKYYGKKSIQYIHGILKNVKEEKSDDFKAKNFEKFKQQKEESDKRFAMRLASGKIDDSAAYRAMVKCKDYDDLNRLYKIGEKALKENDKDIQLATYEWIK